MIMIIFDKQFMIVLGFRLIDDPAPERNSHSQLGTSKIILFFTHSHILTQRWNADCNK